MSDPERLPLCAVRFADGVTGRAIASDLEVRSPGGTWSRTSSGIWVLRAASSVATDAAPLSVAVTASVVDRGRAYLPRSFTVHVPRVMDGSPDLREIVTVVLPPSPIAPLRSTWAAVRIHARLAPTSSIPEGTPLEGVAVRLEGTGLGLRCLTLTNHLGEALAIGHGIPLLSAGEDDSAIVQPSVQHRVSAVLDPALVDPKTGRSLGIPDPDDLWARRGSLRRRSRVLSLAVGASVAHVFDFPRS
ncbi:MAG: hypothetical protein IT378_00295 [Sandaracinaceae bacterium]|nr:hypothetical protein [Sandaracinaceae bacterium]